MTPEARAREFVTVGLRSLGVPSLEPYIEVIAELIEGAEADVRADQLDLLKTVRAHFVESLDALNDLIPMAAELGKPRWPVDGKIAVLQNLLGRIDSELGGCDAK